MAIEGENIGTARIDVSVNADAAAAQLKALEREVSTLGGSAEVQYNKAGAAQKRWIDRQLQTIDLMGKTKAERMAIIAQQRVGGDLADALGRKALAREAELAAGSKTAALDAARFSDAQLLSANRALSAFKDQAVASRAATTAAAEAAAADDARFKQVAAAAMAEVDARKATAAQMAIEAKTREASATATAKQATASRARVEIAALESGTIKAQMADFAMLQRILDGNIKKETELAAAEAALDRLQKQNAVSNVELAAAFEALNKVTEKNTALNAVNAVSRTGLNSRTQYELGVLAGEVASGNTSRIKRSIPALLNASGLGAKLLTPAGLGITGVVAAMAALAAAEVSAEKEALAFNRALAMTGTQSGATGASLSAMANNIGSATGAYGDATKAVLALAQAGQGASPALEGMATLAVRFGDATGDIKSGIEIATVALTGNAQQVADLDKRYNLLTATQANEVQHLFDIGEADKARQIIMRDGSAALAARAKDVQDSTGTIIKAWDAVTGAVSAAWAAMKQAGSSDLSVRLKAINEQLQSARGVHMDASQKFVPNASPEEIARLTNLQSSLQAQLVAQGWKRTNAALDTARQTAAKSAQDWANKSLAPIDELQSQLDKATKARDAFFSVPRSAAESARFMRSYTQQIEKAAQSYSSANKPRTSHGGAKKDNSDKLRQMALDEIQKEVAAEGKLDDQRERSAGAVKAYQNSLNDMLQTRKAQIVLQVQSVGMGDLEIQQQQALIAIDEDYDRKANSLRKQQQNSTSAIDKAAYQQQLDDLAAYHEKRIKLEVAGFAAERAAQGDWANGATAALQNFADQAADVAGQTRSVFSTAFGDMTDALSNFVMTGKLRFKSFADDIIKSMLRIEFQAAESSIMQSLLSMFATGPAGANMGYSGSFNQSATNTTAGNIVSSIWGPNAKGGVYDSPSLARYANGVYDSPRLFGFARGGVFGEDGPEAIMPLSRGADGKLGVKAGGGPQPIELHINLRNESGQALQAKQQGQATMSGNHVMADFVLSTVAGDVAGGGKTAKAFQQRFGLARAGIPVGA